MPRKPSAVLSYKLRIRESLRRRIEAAAKKRGVSLNYEMTSRLEYSFDQEAARSVDAVAAHLSDTHKRLDGIFHRLNMQGDLIRASEALIKQIEQSGNSEAINRAVEKVKQALNTIDAEAATALRKMHTQGVDK